MEDKGLIFFGTLGLLTFNLLIVLFSIIGFSSVGLYMLFFTIPFGIAAIYFDYLVARYFVQKLKQRKQKKSSNDMVLGAVQQQKTSKFWDFVEKLFTPVGWLFDKIEALLEPIKPFVVGFFTIVADLVVAYSIYFIIVTPAIPIIWLLPLVLITFPVLYFFNRYGLIEGFKEWKKNRKENK